MGPPAREVEEVEEGPTGEEAGENPCHSQQLNLSFESMRCGAVDWQKPTEGYEGGPVC